MKYHLHYSAVSGLYVTTLLGGEFPNCHGQGATIESAITSLKIRYNQLKRE